MTDEILREPPVAGDDIYFSHRLPAVTWPDGRAPTVRRMMVDLIEEYARHVGHADLIRESIDGLVGEDPPH